MKWSVELRGSMGHRVLPDLAHQRVLAADGWGLAYPSLGVRAFALADGRALAEVRLKTPARQIADHEGDILLLSDKRLHLLDGPTLTESQRWDAKIPHYGTSLFVGGGFAHIENGSPSVTALDLSSGVAKRKSHPGSISLHALDDESLVVASGEGRISRARFGLARPFETIAQTSPFLGRASDLLGIWMCPGHPQKTEHVQVPGGSYARTIPDAAQTRITYASFNDGSIQCELDLGAWVREMVVSRSGETIAVVTGQHNDAIAVIRRRDLAIEWVRAPGPVEALLPDVGLAWTTRPRPSPRGEEGSADLICFEIPCFEEPS